MRDRFATIWCNGWTARRKRAYPYGGRKGAILESVVQVLNARACVSAEPRGRGPTTTRAIWAIRAALAQDEHYLSRSCTTIAVADDKVATSINEGDLDAPRYRGRRSRPWASENIAVVYDEKRMWIKRPLADVPMYERARSYKPCKRTSQSLRASAHIVYILDLCRRKRRDASGGCSRPDKPGVFINTDVCEAVGTVVWQLRLRLYRAEETRTGTPSGRLIQCVNATRIFLA